MRAVNLGSEEMNVLKLTYLGQCGFLIEGGGTRIVTDPYLSDSVDQLYYSEATPWKRLYAPPTTLAALAPDVVLISHAHGDHLDPWTIAPYAVAGGTAAFAAPAPEVGALKQAGVRRIVAARAEQPFEVGAARITPIACAHVQLHLDGVGQFFELSYLIEMDGEAIFFGGDMSLYDGLTERLARARCRLLLLPCNGRDEARTVAGIVGNIDCLEAARLCRTLNAEAFVPMHHDLYAINGCPREDIEAAALREGVRCLPLAPMESMIWRHEKDCAGGIDRGPGVMVY